MEHKEKPISISSAIVVAGLLVALAVVFTGRGNIAPTQVPPQPSAVTTHTNLIADMLSGQNNANNQNALNNMTPISSSDHILGNPNAPVKIVEYSDLECPFCKQFHATLHQAMNEFGASGQVAWIYRQFPIASLHSKAPNEAEASECANELGGNDVFWKYIDQVFQLTNSNNSLDPAELPIIAQNLGLDVTKFNACLVSQRYAQKIADEIQNAADTGGQGTPWTIVVASNGQKFPLQGAVSYATLRQTIEQALATK